MMKRVFWWLSILLLSVTVVACAPKPRDRVMTHGRDFDRTHVNDIKIGVHDKARIRDWFGEPYHITETNVSAGKIPGCTGRWMYFYSIASSETSGSHMDVKTNQASLIVGFDKKDKVCMSTYSEGAPSKGGATNKK